MPTVRGGCVPGCNGKRVYSSKREAWSVAKILQRKDGDLMTAYRCRWGGYHVGHDRPEEARIRRAINTEKRFGLVP